MKRNLTCIVCPIGCEMEVEIADNTVVSVRGNTCKRGEKYAIEECTNPKRVITTTVRTKSGILPVKTDNSVSKEKMFEIMDKINAFYSEKNFEIGDVVIENIDNEGVNLVVTGKASI